MNGSHTDFLAINVTGGGEWTCKAVRGHFEGKLLVLIMEYFLLLSHEQVPL